MARKRKAPGRADTIDEAKDSNKDDGKVGPIRSYEDVADSEDEFHINRDKVMLDDGPETKRRKKWEQENALLEPSDEEVLGYSAESSEVEDGDTGDVIAPREAAAMGSSDEGDQEVDEDAGGWGSFKLDYYDADIIETEADALEEEAEAKRLQHKKLQKMSEADFGFDENEWLDEGDHNDHRDVVTEILKDIEITTDMVPEERLRILQTRYPEFEFLANDFIQLLPLLQSLRQQSDSEMALSNSTPIAISSTVIKCRALTAYVATLTMYFAILTSPAKEGIVQARPLDPVELRDHAVMDSLLKCRELWLKVRSLKTSEPRTLLPGDHSMAEPETLHAKDVLQASESNIDRPAKKSKSVLVPADSTSEAGSRRAKTLQQVEDELADLSSLIPKSRKVTKKVTRAALVDDHDSDFGEEENLDDKYAAEKANKKKSLRFYTSQIAQKANRRADAGRDAGGDADLPYKERLKDRQARLNAEAERRGKKLDDYGRGVDLGGESGDEDIAAAHVVRGEEDEYYDMVAKSSKKRRADKYAESGAIAAAKAEGKMVTVFEDEVDMDGKRAIGYVIKKNKGLAPKRKKEVRNPRVKKRKKFEEKKKKLSSIRAVYKGGEERGGYGGEKTGIKTGLVKSVKL